MRTQNRSIPRDMPSLWNMNRRSVGDTETAIRAWFEMSSQAQEQVTKFMSGRWAKDAVALAQLGRCKTPADALNVQASYLAGAYADYINEGQRIVGLVSDIVRETMPGASVEPALSTTGKSKHRVAAH